MARKKKHHSKQHSGNSGHGHKDHTGRINHGSAHLDGLGKDPHASKEHHAANAEHDMDEGLGVEGGYECCGPTSEGGAPSETENASHY